MDYNKLYSVIGLATDDLMVLDDQDENEGEKYRKQWENLSEDDRLWVADQLFEALWSYDQFYDALRGSMEHLAKEKVATK